MANHFPMKVYRFCSILVFTCTFLLAHNTASAQKFHAPEEYTLEKKDDFRRYDNEIIKCADWLENTRYDEDNEAIKKAVNFMAEWVSGCPYINFSRNVRIDAVFSDCPTLRVFYMSGWARNALKNEGKTNKIQNCIAGLKCALKVYASNRSIGRSSGFDELQKIDRQGSLNEWVEDRMK